MVKKVNKFDISEILYIFGAELYIFLGIIRDANFSLGQRALFNKINKGLSLFSKKAKLYCKNIPLRGTQIRLSR